MLQHLLFSLVLVVDAQAQATTPPADAPSDVVTEPTPWPTPALESLDDFEAAVAGAAAVSAATPEEPAPREPDAPAPASTSEGPKLLVLDLADVGAGADTTTGISAAVSAQAIKSFAGTVVTTQQLAIALDAASMQQLMGCAAEQCMTDIAKTVAAERVLGGSVAKVGDDLLITVLVVEVATGKRIASEQRKVPVYREMFYYAAKELTALVLTGRATSDVVPVRIEASEADARVLVDGAERGAAPLSIVLDPGTHEIRVERDGYASWRTSVVVEEGTPVLVSAELVAESFPLWPVALAVGGMSLLAASGAAGAGLYALELYDGSVTKSEAALAQSYKYGAPVDSITLAERRVFVEGWQLASNVMWGVAGVLFVSAILIETADVVLWAME